MVFSKFNKKYLSKLNFLEVWVLILFVILIIACKYFGWLLLPIFLLLSTTILFAFILILIVVLIPLIKNGKKRNVILPLIKMGLLSNIDMTIDNIDFLNIPTNTILIANYPANFVEYLLPHILFDEFERKICTVITKKGNYWAKMFLDSECLIDLNEDNNNFESLSEKIKTAHEKGHIPLVYPERNFSERTDTNEIREFRRGIFEIAEREKTNIIILHIEHINHFCGFIKDNNIRVRMEYLNGYDSKVAREKMMSMNIL